MNATLVADMETLRRTALRLERVGLVIDHASLSPAQRRAFFALQRLLADLPTRPLPPAALIGFPYPNAR